MKKAVLILFFSLLLSALTAQPFSIGHRSFTVTDPARGRQIPIELYYPSDVAGTNVPFTAQPLSAPIVVFGHGFVMTWDAYANIWQSLVPAGYVVAFPTTEGSFAPSHLEFGKDLAFTVTAIQAEGQTSGSTLYGHVDSAACVMGHSMGGGSSLLAVQYNSSIRALANLAAAETNPSAIAAASNITIPALLFAGANDCVAPPTAHQLPMYLALSSGCKTYISITGGSHCQMADNNTLCSFGEATCTPSAAISRAAQHSVIDNYLVPWLNYQLKGDCTAGAAFDALIASDPSITSLQNCLLCNSTGFDHTNLLNTRWELHPNPVAGRLQVNINSEFDGALQVLDAAGRLIRTYAIRGASKELDVHTLPAGDYRAVLFDGKHEYPVLRFLKQD